MRVIVAGFPLLSTSSLAEEDYRLVGVWKSNRELTIESLLESGSVSSRALERIAPLFGRMVVTYDSKFVTTELPPGGERKFKLRNKYRVTSKSPDSVTISADDGTTTTLHFVSERRYWIPLGGANQREYFDRFDP